jgi:formyl-CoA transferase
MNSLPLSRFKVIDLTRVRSGPTCVRELGDWGAQVLKIESKELAEEQGEDRLGADFQNLHRNKRSMVLNLKTPEGLEVLEKLVAQADVLVENYRPDVKFRLKIDYERMAKINARLVYASISGFGQDGPYSARPGFDQIAQGMGGLMSVTGLPGHGPLRAGIAVADLCSGIFAALGIMIALLEREESGKGQWVQSSLLAAQIFMLDFQAARWTVEQHVPGQAGNEHPTAVPTSVYKTADGHMNIAAGTPEMLRRLSHALGIDSVPNDPRYSTVAGRLANRDALNADIEAVTQTKSTAEWVAILTEAGVPAGPIYKIDEVFADPQVRHLNLIRAIPHKTRGEVSIVGQPIELSRTKWEVRTSAPEMGEHTDSVLRELGYDAEAIAALRATKVVA